MGEYHCGFCLIKVRRLYFSAILHVLGVHCLDSCY